MLVVKFAKIRCTRKMSVLQYWQCGKLVLNNIDICVLSFMSFCYIAK